MSLTPQRSPYPKLTQNTGATGTFPTPSSVTTKDGVVTEVTPGTTGNTGGNGGSPAPSLVAFAPLSLAGNTLTIGQVSVTDDGYLSSAQYAQILASLPQVGLLADRPVDPDVAAGFGASYFATDVPAYFVWDGSAWNNICLCPSSSSSSSSNNSSSSSSSSM